MHTIKLTKEESEKVTNNLRKGGIKLKDRIKVIKFHKEFSKGLQLQLCLHCGYPKMFMGLPQPDCECNKPKQKAFRLTELDKFISELQKIYYRQHKDGL